MSKSQNSCKGADLELGGGGPAVTPTYGFSPKKSNKRVVFTRALCYLKRELAYASPPHISVRREVAGCYIMRGFSVRAYLSRSPGENEGWRPWKQISLGSKTTYLVNSSSYGTPTTSTYIVGCNYEYQTGEPYIKLVEGQMLVFVVGLGLYMAIHLSTCL